MPFQPINFASVSPIKYGQADILGSLAKGLQISDMPRQMKRARERETLQNAMSRLQLGQAPQLFEAQKGLTESQSALQKAKARQQILESAYQQAQLRSVGLDPFQEGGQPDIFSQTQGAPQQQLGQQAMQAPQGAQGSIQPGQAAIPYREGLRYPEEAAVAPEQAQQAMQGQQPVAQEVPSDGMGVAPPASVPGVSEGAPAAARGPSGNLGYISGVPGEDAFDYDSVAVLDEGSPRLYGLDDTYRNATSLQRTAIEKVFPYVKRRILPNLSTGEVSYTITLPSGRVESAVKRHGRGPVQLASRTEEAKQEVRERYEVKKPIFERLQSADSMMLNYDNLITRMEEIPEFFESVGLVTGKTTPLVGTPEMKGLVGKIQNSLGQIVVTAARDLRGSFTRTESGVINAFKPNVNEHPYIFWGKVNAAVPILNVGMQRDAEMIDLIEKGMKPSKARKVAISKYSLKDAQKEADETMEFSRKLFTIYDKKKMPEFKSKKAYDSFFANLTEKQKGIYINVASRVGG